MVVNGERCPVGTIRGKAGPCNGEWVFHCTKCGRHIPIDHGNPCAVCKGEITAEEVDVQPGTGYDLKTMVNRVLG